MGMQGSTKKKGTLSWRAILFLEKILDCVGLVLNEWQEQT